MSERNSEFKDENSDNKTIDPSLMAKQVEWEHLYLHPNFTTEYEEVEPPHHLSEIDKSILAAQWYKDALSGRKIEFPQSTFELKCLKIARSRVTLTVFSLTCFVHMCIPFFYYPHCSYDLYSNGELPDPDSRLHKDFPRYQTLQLIELLLTFVYMFELSAILAVNNFEKLREKRFRDLELKDNWVLFRTVCVLAIFFDCLFGLSGAYGMQILFVLK